MCGKATLTTVASSMAIPLAATVATSAIRPLEECSASPSTDSSATSIATCYLVRVRACSAGGELGLVLGDHLLDGFHVAVGQLRPAVNRPCLRVQGARCLSLELGHHALGDQFIAAVGRHGVGPLVCQLQVGAEAAGLLGQPLDLLACHVGGTDRTEARLVDEVDHLADVVAGHR